MKGESSEMIRIEVLRTPEERFEDLPDYVFTPHYVEIDADGGACGACSGAICFGTRYGAQGLIP
jgi:hypothetical protein